VGIAGNSPASQKPSFLRERAAGSRMEAKGPAADLVSGKCCSCFVFAHEAGKAYDVYGHNRASLRVSVIAGPSQQRRSNITRLAGKVSEVDASVVSQFKFAAAARTGNALCGPQSLVHALTSGSSNNRSIRPRLCNNPLRPAGGSKQTLGGHGERPLAKIRAGWPQFTMHITPHAVEHSSASQSTKPRS